MKCPKGMTLLELILALFLFITVVPLFAAMWPINHRAVNQSRAHLGASHICRQVLDEAISLGYQEVETLTTRPEPDRTIALTETHEDHRTGEPVISRQTNSIFVWEVTTGTTGLMEGEKLVRALVRWNEAGEERSLEMSTLLHEASAP